MELDPTIVRAFSEQVRTAATSIADAALGRQISRACDAMPGSTSQYASRLVGEYMARLVTDFSSNVAVLGDSVQVAGDTLTVQDEQVRARLEKAWDN